MMNGPISMDIIGIDPATTERKIQMRDANGTNLFPAASEMILGRVNILEIVSELSEQVFLLKEQVSQLKTEIKELKRGSNGYSD